MLHTTQHTERKKKGKNTETKLRGNLVRYVVVWKMKYYVQSLDSEIRLALITQSAKGKKTEQYKHKIVFDFIYEHIHSCDWL